MRLAFAYVIILLLTGPAAVAQVGIGTTTVNASAILELSSTARGFLPPRLTQAERNAIATPATGLLVFQTDNTPGLYYYTGAAWVPVAGAGSQWTTAGTDIYYNTGNVGIGTTTPGFRMDVFGGIRTGGNGADGQLVIYSEQGATDYTLTFNPNPTMTANVTWTFPPNAGTAGQVLSTDGSGNLSWITGGSTGWAVGGNTIANPNTQYIGTNSSHDFALRAGGGEVLRLTTLGGVLLGSSAAGRTITAADQPGGAGTAITLAGGSADLGTAEDGGNLRLFGGESNDGNGGNVELAGGYSDGGSAGGTVTIRGGDAGNNGGGNVLIHAGSGLSIGDVFLAWDGTSRTGGVGVGQGNATAQLDIAGWESNAPLRLRSQTAAPGAPNVGDIYANGTTMFYRASTGWVDLGGGGGSQWTTSGTSINYTAGSVGIGIAVPAATLDVNGSVRFGPSASSSTISGIHTAYYNIDGGFGGEITGGDGNSYDITVPAVDANDLVFLGNAGNGIAGDAIAITLSYEILNATTIRIWAFNSSPFTTTADTTNPIRISVMIVRVP